MRQKFRGQSLVEFALVAPLLFLVILVSIDLSRGFFYSAEISGASREGMRLGVQSDTDDIGDSIRSEPNTAIQNSVAVWGATGIGQTNGDCLGKYGGTCGDPNGCVPASFVGNQIACFAIRTCTVPSSNNEICSAYSGWSQRPAVGSGNGLQVTVVYKFLPVTGWMTKFAGAGGYFYLTSNSTGVETY